MEINESYNSTTIDTIGHNRLRIFDFEILVSGEKSKILRYAQNDNKL